MSTTTNNIYERYNRQILLKLFGEKSQHQLLSAKVLVIGAGGLGCPVLLYLAGAGIGTIGIMDDDKVTLSNLNRQLLYTSQDIGFFKAERSSFALQQLNPDIQIKEYSFRLTTTNAIEILTGYDIIIDCTDNFSSRYLINDVCVLLKKPLIYGSIYQFEGQVAVFNCQGKNGISTANYRDLFPQPPGEQEVPSCNEAGVIGVVPGIIGTMMATECIKLITGIGKLLINQLLIYNALNNQISKYELEAKAETRNLIPGNSKALKEMQYDLPCAGEPSFTELTVTEFNQLMQEKDTIVIDVREENEQPSITAFQHINLPMSLLKKGVPLIKEKNILLFCHSGIRSSKAALLFSNGQNKVYHLKGGIIKWMAQN